MNKLSRTLVALAAAFSVLMGAAATSALAAPPVALSGAYLGAASLPAQTSFATWRGAPATLASDYLARSWSSIAYPGWWLSAWQPFTSTGAPLVLGVPMVTTTSETFADGAAGAYDSSFESLAQNLVADGDSNAIIRLGWEFNGTWYPWSLTATGADDPSEFVADWQHIVTLMRSVPGEAFKFDWNVNNGPEPVDATQAYPGNAYVDYVGVDSYDEGYGVSTASARWNQILNQTDGLNFWASFASQHGKPITIPEWGLSNDSSGGGDDPYYIQQMYNWLKSNNAGFESYYDQDGFLTSGSYPNAAAEYQSLWSDASTSGSTGTGTGTTTTGTTTTTTPVTTTPPKPVSTTPPPKPKKPRTTTAKVKSHKKSTVHKKAKHHKKSKHQKKAKVHKKSKA